MILTTEEMKVFDLYYAGIVSMGMFHPGAGRSNGYGPNAPTYTFDDCAAQAMAMIEARRAVLSESVEYQRKQSLAARTTPVGPFF